MLISFAITAKLICVFVFAYAKRPVFSRRGSNVLRWPLSILRDEQSMGSDDAMSRVKTHTSFPQKTLNFREEFQKIKQIKLGALCLESTNLRYVRFHTFCCCPCLYKIYVFGEMTPYKTGIIAGIMTEATVLIVSTVGLLLAWKTIMWYTYNGTKTSLSRKAITQQQP